jgi:1,4-alpha-glucan branching enzyme
LPNRSSNDTTNSDDRPTIVSGAPVGFTRFRFRITHDTLSSQGIDDSELAASHISFIPVLEFNSVNYYDHNRVTGAFDTYTLWSGDTAGGLVQNSRQQSFDRRAVHREKRFQDLPMRIALLAFVPLASFLGAACSNDAEAVHGPSIDASASSGSSIGSKFDASTSADATRDANAINDAAAAANGSIAVPPSGVQAGATVQDDGVLFRVWAPNATAAAVAGDFTTTNIALNVEADGYFAAKVPVAKAGQHYHFTFTSNGSTITRVDPRARQFTNNGSDAVIIDPRTYAWQSAPFTPPSPQNAIIYELHVASFGGSGTTPGTFATMSAHLDYLKALGVNMIELMPSNEYSGSVAWGYNPTGYLAPYENYGAPDDMRALVDAAHAHGIGVMLDVVYNHYSGGHSGLWCFDGDCPKGDAGSGDAGIGTNGIYFFGDATYGETPWGPRPAFSTKQVHDFIVDGIYSWLSEYRIDGFRWDSVSNIRAVDGTGTVPGGPQVLSDTNAMTHQFLPSALVVAEDYKGDANVTAPIATGGLGFDAQWDGWNSAVDGAVTAATDAARSMSGIASVLSYTYNNVATQRVIFTDNHDIDGNGAARLPSVIDPAAPTSLLARKKSMLASLLLFTSPGIPMLFEGQEMLATGSFDNPPAAIDWTLPTTNAPIVAFYKDLIALRLNSAGTTAGLVGGSVNVFQVNDTAKVIAYARSDAAGNNVVIVANFSQKAFATYDIGFPSAGPWHTRLNSDAQIYSADFGNTPSGDIMPTSVTRDGLPFTGSVVLAPYSALVFSK